MSSLMLDDEQRFNRDLRALMAGGLSSGLVGALLSTIAGGHAYALMAISFAGLVGLFSASSEKGGETPILRVLLGLIGGGIAATAFPNPVFGAVLGGAALGLALSLEQELQDQIGAVAALAITFGAGVFSSETLIASGALEMIDFPFIQQLAQGSIWGTFSVLGIGATQLRWREDPHVEQIQGAREAVGGEESHHMREAERLYKLIREEASEKASKEIEQKSRRIAVHVLEALEALARRSHALRNALEDNPGNALEHRIERLEERIEHASEPSIRHELEAARADLVEQVDMRGHIETAITRLELRQQRCVTALERLHIHLVQESSIEVADRGLDASLEELEDMASEISWRNLSIDKLCDPLQGEIDDMEVDEDDIDVELDAKTEDEAGDSSSADDLESTEASSTSSPHRQETSEEYTLADEVSEEETSNSVTSKAAATREASS